jgi:hypothetical protein
LWQRLLKVINNLLPVEPLHIKEEALTELDPNRIYVENVRSLLDVSYKTAEAICETATRQGLFKRIVEVRCPDGAVGAEAESEELLPDHVECWVDEEGHLEPRETETNALQKVIYYRLSESSRIAHA